MYSVPETQLLGLEFSLSTVVCATDASRSRFQHKLKFGILARLQESVLMVPRAANTKAAKLKASSSGACNNAGNNTAERQRQRQPQWRFKRQQQNVLAALGKDTRTHVNKYVYVCAALTHVHKRSAAAGNSYNACVVDAYTLSLVIVCALNCQHNKSAHSNSLHKCQFSNTLISFRQLNVSDEPSNCHCSAQ